jgi:hypothetical protein
VIETQSATVNRETELHSAAVSKVIYPHFATRSEAVEPSFNIVSNDCFFTLIIGIISFLLYQLINIFKGDVRLNFYISGYDLM